MEHRLVAVYGSLREGLHNHRLLKNSECVGKGSVSGYGMYSLGGFPALTKLQDKCDVVVEVYSVDDNTMARLDMLEGYPHYYNREQVAIHFGGEDGVESYTTAWMYYIDDTFDDSAFVKDGDWLKYYSGE